MRQRVLTFGACFSRRRAPKVTVGTALSPHCLRVCSKPSGIFSICLHRFFQPVIVGQLCGSLTYFTVTIVHFSSPVVYRLFPFFLLKHLPREDETNTIVSPIHSRVRPARLECLNALPSPSMPFAIHHRRCGFSSIIVGRPYSVLGTDDLFFILARQRNIL